MPWQNVQNCHGFLLLLLILLIVTLVAAQLLWQYFVPSSLVAALDHKWHLAPNTNINSLPLLIKRRYAATFDIKYNIKLTIAGFYVSIIQLRFVIPF